MKDWQQGFELEWLKELAAPFIANFTPFTYGAFGIPKERDVATALKEKSLLWCCDIEKKVVACAIAKECGQDGSHTDFCQRKFKVKKGDLFIHDLAGTLDGMKRLLTSLVAKAGTKPIVIEIFEEAKPTKELVEGFGFKFCTVKIPASSELKSLYILNDVPDLRMNEPLEQHDITNIKTIQKKFATAAEIIQMLAEIEANADFANHYSSYNKRKSWSALALRGFDANDPTFIIKPAEMSRKWKEENAEKLLWSCNDTPLAEKMPTVMKVAARMGSPNERVRIMRLAKGEGELTRHADITDRNAGTKDGMIARLHLPLQTMQGCEFYSWSMSGEKRTEHFPVGALFYLDMRKPHAVINNSSTERIHLVVDAVSNERIRNGIK